MGGKTQLDLHPRGSLLGIVPITFLFFCSFYIFTMSPLCYFYVLSTFFITCKLVINLDVFQFCSQHLSNMLWHFLNMNSWIVTIHCVLMCFIVASPLHFWLPHQCHIMLGHVPILECTPTTLHPHTCKLAPSIFSLIYTLYCYSKNFHGQATKLWNQY